MTTPARIKRLRARADAARHFPVNTCPASRHADLIADMLLQGYPHAVEDMQHCGESIMRVRPVEAPLPPAPIVVPSVSVRLVNSGFRPGDLVTFSGFVRRPGERWERAMRIASVDRHGFVAVDLPSGSAVSGLAVEARA